MIARITLEGKVAIITGEPWHRRGHRPRLRANGAKVVVAARKVDGVAAVAASLGRSTAPHGPGPRGAHGQGGRLQAAGRRDGRALRQGRRPRRTTPAPTRTSARCSTSRGGLGQDLRGQPQGLLLVRPRGRPARSSRASAPGRDRQRRQRRRPRGRAAAGRVRRHEGRGHLDDQDPGVRARGLDASASTPSPRLHRHPPRQRHPKNEELLQHMLARTPIAATQHRPKSPAAHCTWPATLQVS